MSIVLIEAKEHQHSPMAFRMATLSAFQSNPSEPHCLFLQQHQVGHGNLLPGNG